MKFALALLVASTSAVRLSTYGDCDWECKNAGSVNHLERADGGPNDQWRSYDYPHRGADLKKPLDHQQRWDTYLPDFHQQSACNCASFVQKMPLPSHTDKPTTVLLQESLNTPAPWTWPMRDGPDKTLVSKDNKSPMSGEVRVSRPSGSQHE